MTAQSSATRRPSHGNVGSAFAKELFGRPAERKLKANIEKGLERVETVLSDQVQYADKVAQVTTTYLLGAGGKRLRPMLVLLSAQLGPNSDSDAVLTAAAATEITHLASLYHDDVMDEATLRRGVTAAHLRWSNSMAILAGDLLFARASQMFSHLGQDAIRLQATVFERLVLGQMHETIGPAEGEDRIDHYLRVLSDKTGSLIGAAAEYGVMLSGAPQAFRGALSDFGEGIGVAFQIVDDVIDLSPTSEKTGKLAGTDLRAGVETLPVLLLERRANGGDADAADLLERIRTRVAGTAPGSADQSFAREEPRGSDDPAEVDAIIAELREHEVSKETLEAAETHVARAIESLEPLPSGVVKEALREFADRLINRDF
ncbi:polyprenyl synthetase family protein [Gulosibacter molinativorax]|uniref:polyprenyl synthetase family protein n=1 Tax=Gulosibacter molinativorax TaxID=256821 RepID=UPI000479D4CB|nr:polyprenyl synthetase family protein [Gulosibacter molinativorax]QUY63423.1 Trans-hexaprenyltranstransferase [Gulosibacter molinativorax]